MADEFAVESLRLARRAFGRAAGARPEDSDADMIPRILSERLMERLSSLAIEPAVVLDVGSALPHRQQQLMQLYPAAVSLRAVWHELQCDQAGHAESAEPENNRLSGSKTASSVVGLAGQVAARAVASVVAKSATVLPGKFHGLLPASRAYGEFATDPCALPLRDASVDLVVACQVLPWCPLPGSLFAEIHRVLTPGGAFFWSSVGPDTLQEYRQLWAAIDSYPHVFGLYDMHDLGDEMLRSGFDSPVLDRENLTINYQSVDHVVADMRAAGAFGLAAGRRRGLMASSIAKRLGRVKGGAIDVTIEHVQGHGWKSTGQIKREISGNNEEIRIPVSAIGRGSSR